MADPSWRKAGLLAGGGLAAFALMLGPVLWYERRASADVDQAWVPLLAAAALVGLAVAWRRPAARLAFLGAAPLLVFFALLLNGLWLPAGLLLAGAAGVALWKAPSPVRLLLGLPAVWGFALVVAFMAAASDGVAPLSGLLLAALGLAYPLVWALREPARWARHVAWAAALAWCALAAGYALMDLAAFGDGLAVVSSLLLVLGCVAILVAWPVHSRSLTHAVAAA